MAIPSSAITNIISTTIGRPQVQAGSAQEVVGTFADAFKKAISDVEGMQVRADDLIQKLQTGQTQDVHQVMAAAEEAGLSMQLALQFRNKALDAYQEIMRMQV